MGAQEKPSSSSNSMQRVKVYRLNEDGKWDDQGTGHVSLDYVERSEELSLFVFDEDDSYALLRHRICPDDIYRKQEETIISWKDPDCSAELALSFQETAGCSYIWENICSAQRNLQYSNLNNETFHSVNSESRELPAVDLSTLPLILKIVTDCGLNEQMRVTELVLHDQQFFRKMMDLFWICEDLENIDSLHMLYKIIKGIILLNSQQIFEKIFGDDLIMDIIGCLEYEPDVPRVHHRSFLNEHVVFKEAIPIKNRVVLSKIHQTYRVGYVKDVVLPRVLDEATVATLTSMMHANNAIVVSLLKDDNTFVQELFAKLKSPTTEVESKKKLVHFLHEFCTSSKSLQMVQQLRLFRDLVDEGIMDIIIDILQSEDKRLVLTGTDILILFLNQDPNLLRSYVIRPEGIPLLGLLVQGMLTDFGDNMHCQFLEILRCLLDSYPLSGPQRDTIVEIFYKKHLGQLIEVITTSCPVGANVHEKCADRNAAKCTSAKPEILLSICELLCFCVLHHPYRIKCNFLLNNVLDKVLLLTKRRERYLVVAAVRFFRTIITRCDDQLSNYIIKHNLLKPVVDAFVENGNRYNLLNSVVLELLEYIRKENLRALIKCVVESFWIQLEKFENIASINSFKLKYEQALDNTGTSSSLTVVDSRKRVDERALEKEEEDYFNGDSDEEDTASASMSRSPRAQSRPIPNGSSSATSSPSQRSSGLVDYDYDEDDEDYKPPPRRQSDASSDGDEETLESLSSKRKLRTKEESGTGKRLRLEKPSKPKDSVFAALCSTLSQAVLPNKKVASATSNISRSSDAKRSLEIDNHREKQAVLCRGIIPENYHPSSDHHDHGKENEKDAAGKSCSDNLHNNASDNGQVDAEDSPLLPSSTSSEMAVNGS
ncbi:hypothetical protein Dimus_028493 [Dionaea muscipula]